MTRRGTVLRHAPGKLFIAGEYAVIEPGHPAILVAVDRQVSVTVSGSDGTAVTIESDLVPGGLRQRRHDGALAPADADGQPAQKSLGHVVSAIEVVDELLTARGQPTPPIHVSIRSRLHRDGIKFGLGSSGAVTVATVTAAASYSGLQLSPEQRFRLAMLATARRDARASGGDLAASIWGGWIAYQAPDRAAVLELAQRRGIEEMLRSPWPGFELRRLPPPRGLSLEVGWTGQPASTATLVGQLGSTSRRSFVARSDACVHAAIRALEQGADQELMHRVRGTRQVLAELDCEVGLGIFTTRLTALCDAAEAVGGAAKPSGAGGGDCGIALLDVTARKEISRLRKEWVDAGVLPLPIHVEPTNGNEE